MKSLVVAYFLKLMVNKYVLIQGAGAGAEVTARGVFGDILRLSKHIN